ncbi:MAG: NADPH:quinone reductase, partial [Gammaproteobacteria bacterium]|nr:NADPH:quinone reductase [Gammaproteobacteria bacterium]
MKAAWYNAFGTPQDVLQIGKLPDPQVSGNQVLVRLQTSGVNPSDVKKRAGSFPHLLDDGLVIPHSDGAGIIEAVGDAVSPERIGERVWVYQAQYGRRLGTAAEYLSIDAVRAICLPTSASFAVGACLGIPAMTAHRCVFADGDINGQHILVTGGAGRVAYYAIQWAKSAGAIVVATASNPADEESCKNIGADFVVNHRQQNWGEHVLQVTAGKRMDRVIDVEFGANLGEVLKCIETGGIIATYSSTQVPEPKLPFLSMMYQDLT